MTVIPVQDAEGKLFGHSVKAADNFFIRGRRQNGLLFFSFLRAGVSDNFGSWQGGQRRADDDRGGDYLDDIGLHLMRC